MANLESSSTPWRKSTASAQGNCVEVSFADESVLMRNSRNPEGPVLSFTHSEWEAFLTGVRNSEFDILSPDMRASALPLEMSINLG